ncbi:ankyrin repeat protein, putative [Trichomonas vaginalis G3]|uniref:Ankyrin repeat protein, putative n=1 Tax=Trichomonas vaginalis (strain ATCC PRA-98 / G3) TaxID=412133 RepID=A2FG89_TRIV3|nr:ankyrin repeat and SOCS box-containing protein 4 family [Trichomonas vaginalis G3]EAX96085.1 ankyrin repeat protein, putative [Trichomonas vaginalis G3]KAI5528543.1 ankyrin repeat and SOCS box-containing protein 4 family [Trichomonas vaginalis G3]|eukprot:XP_001309015.1 ankyrin repeat protein [Trichomonas vaginalis G3]
MTCNRYKELEGVGKDIIDVTTKLYSIKTFDEDAINNLYQDIKRKLIDTKIFSPVKILQAIEKAGTSRNKYFQTYLQLFKMVYVEYHPEQMKDASAAFIYYLYKEYGMLAFDSTFEQLRNIDSQKLGLEVHENNTIYKAIVNDDIVSFINFTETDGFDENQRLLSVLYPVSNSGYSLLELCSYHGSVNCFKLLRTKFKSEITNKCLHFSFLSGNPDIMSECLKVVQPDKACMDYALISHNIDFVTFLMNTYNVELEGKMCAVYHNLQAFFVLLDQTTDINSCFIKSSSFNIPSICEYFLSRGADINARSVDKFRFTALHNAIEYDNLRTAEFLLSRGIDINAQAVNGLNALIFSALFSSKESVEFLISHGIDTKARSLEGNDAIQLASMGNNIEIVKYLLSKGFDINSRNKEGITPFHTAILFNSMNVAEYLLSAGADVNIKDYYDATPLHIAAQKNNITMIEFLINHGANIKALDNHNRTPLHSAAETCSIEALDLLLSHGLDVNAKDDIGYTILNYSTESNSIELAEFAINHGADINSRANEGTTPLMDAALRRSLQIAQILIAKGADVNAKDKLGGTALHYAALGGSHQIYNLLIAHGADVNAKDIRNITASDILRTRNPSKPNFNDLQRCRI